GMKLGDVDQKTGEVTVDVPTGTLSGSYDVPVTVTYPDGTKDQTTVKVNVKDNVQYQATAKDDVTTGLGQTPTAESVI
ncbi:YPDG domain-containing protein, partial [Ligilactobacillus equi]|uniref:YPDG domain-containing protein n=1 Tax=Ligilactobacillus equi TaxID=137357 RepID=UPI000A470B83